MKLIYSLFLLGLTGCVALAPAQPKVDATKKQIETQRAEMEKKLKIDNSYKIDGRYIYFYSPEKKLVKNIDVLTRNEFYFDSDEKLVNKTYHPKKEVKRLSSGIPFQENENYYNSLALLTRSEVWMYGIYNNSVVYTYDKLLRRSKELYMDANDNIYTTKHYSYKDSFYIDKISDYIAEKVLKAEEKEFNQSVLYGKDVEVAQIISEAKQFPFGAEKRVVIVKEAQNIKNIEKLETYLNSPQPSTLLVICYKYKKIDKRKKFGKTLCKKALVFESKRFYDNQVSNWIAKYLSE